MNSIDDHLKKMNLASPAKSERRLISELQMLDQQM